MTALSAELTTTCYRHPREQAGVRCQRCEKFICPDCMHNVPVGFHCPACMKSGRQRVFNARTMFHSHPVLTETLVGLNLVAFAAGLAMGGRVDPGMVPHELLALGALNGPSIAKGEVYRLLTSGFLHVGLLHLFMNMLVLCQLGPLIESRLGATRFGLLYLVSLFGGSLGALLLSPSALTAGASGALFGLAGALLAQERHLGIDITRSAIGASLLFNGIVTILMPGISIGGHAGGFIFGYAAGVAIFVLPRKSKWAASGSQALVIALGGLAIAGGLWTSGLSLQRFF